MTVKERGRAALMAALVGGAILGWSLPGEALAASDPLGTDGKALAGAGTSSSKRPAPIREFVDRQGRACRVYERRIVVEGENRTAYATVCREPNGRWVLTR